MLKKGISNIALIGLLSIIFLCSLKLAYAQEINSDAKGVVAGASVARSSKEAITKLPIETYFGDAKYSTTQDQLNALGVKVDPEDSVATFPDPSLNIGSIIRIVRATPIIIVDGKKTKNVKSWAPTIKDMLTEQNINLAQDDKINPSVVTEITPNQTITIVRVQISQLSEKDPVDFKQIKKDDPTLDQGKTRVSQIGKKGERTKTYEVTRENGEEISRKLLNNEITKDPIDEITLIGTKPAITTACRFNDTVLAASTKYGVDPNQLCTRMMVESHGNPKSDGGAYKGLFQYDPGFWASASAKAGYQGASIWDATAQIHTTAWAWSHGLRSRWPK